MNCGGNSTKLNHYRTQKFTEYEVYFDQRLILCDFCDVDFSSYDVTYFGFKKGKRIGLNDFNFVKEIPNNELHFDHFCPKCLHRLSFLKFIKKCRIENEDLDNK
ncbi:MAG: hypothetical protein A2724_06800 [Fluviicola sp. RIFCSPHIGHO2_01_FULL_43_53]|nr:MAG: hypothetical protein A2724_06800 [Fluviicola sp. RIFCSPHIGHO2_01_FULL_43_53]